MLLLIRGASESATVNAIMVCIKLTVLLFFVVVGITGWQTDNLAGFAPFGVKGIWAATGGIFFSFIGLDAVSTAGEEVRDPQRTMPRAIVLALVIVTSVYLLVALVGVAAQPWQRFEGQTAGLSQILQDVTGSSWPGSVVAGGAIISIFSVTLVILYAQTRILFSISGDGLLPKVFSRINYKTQTPIHNTIIVSVGVAVIAGFIPLTWLTDVTSVGTLGAFSVVSAAVIILRRREPNLDRKFKVPLYPVLPIASIAFCLFVIAGLPPVTWLVFLGWIAVVLAIYFLYGIEHSTLALRGRAAAVASSDSARKERQ